MDDLEICKRIAEIEGIPVWDGKNEVSFQKTGLPYNPLTDDALCFQLMVKYKVQFNNCLRDNESITNCCVGNKYVTQKNKSPNKAVCLAIIEAHKESQQ